MKTSVIRQSATQLLLLVALALSPVLLAPGAGAQEDASLRITQVIVAPDGASLQAIVSLEDGEGNPVRDALDFEVQVDGEETQRADVQPVVDQETGLSLLLLVDVSGSMDGEPIEQARMAAAVLINSLLPNDVAAVLPFAGSAPAAATFVGDKPALLASINALTIENATGTALYDATYGAFELSASAPTERRAIVLLTDGRDTADGTHPPEDALALATIAQLPVFTIGLGDQTDVAFLQELATRSSGQFYLAPAPADMAAIFEALGESLRSQYVLDVPLTTAPTANRSLLVSTSLEGSIVTGELDFLAPEAMRAVDADDDSGSVPAYVWLLIPAAIAAVGLPLLARRGLLRRRRRTRKGAVRGGQTGAAPVLRAGSTASASSADALLARLRVTAGPGAGAEATTGESPLEIGAAERCGLRLEGDHVSAVHTRVWLRRDRLIVHHVGRGETLVQGKPVEWASLESGQTFTIGEHTIAFSLEG